MASLTHYPITDAWVILPERPRAQRTKSRGPKGLQLEVGARRAPRLLVKHIIQYTPCSLGSILWILPVALGDVFPNISLLLAVYRYIILKFCIFMKYKRVCWCSVINIEIWWLGLSDHWSLIKWILELMGHTHSHKSRNQGTHPWIDSQRVQHFTKDTSGHKNEPKNEWKSATGKRSLSHMI